MTTIEAPVLVVGGGITGLSSALFLAWHGVPCVLVERHPDLLIHPRARGLTPRTVELYRQVGLEGAIQRSPYAGSDFSWAPVLAQTLNDDTYDHPDEPQEDDGAGASPCSFGPIDQDKLEILVRDEARRLGADLRFSTELTSFEQHGVTATVTDRGTGNESAVVASYLIAADGVDSPVRQRLDIPTDGPGPLYSTMTAIVEADLNPALRGRTATIAYLQRPQPYTIMMAHDQTGTRWVFGTGYDPATTRSRTLPPTAWPAWCGPRPACPTSRSRFIRRSPAPTSPSWPSRSALRSLATTAAGECSWSATRRT